MPAATYNLKIEQGVPFARTIHVTSGGQPFDLTDYEATAQIRSSQVDESAGDPGAPLAEFDCSVDNPLTGEITFELADTAASAIPATTQGHTYFWDLKIRKSRTAGFRLLEGKVTVSAAVTISPAGAG